MLDEILTSIDEGTTDQPTQQSQPYVPNFVLGGESAGTECFGYGRILEQGGKPSSGESPGTYRFVSPTIHVLVVHAG